MLCRKLPHKVGKLMSNGKQHHTLIICACIQIHIDLACALIIKAVGFTLDHITVFVQIISDTIFVPGLIDVKPHTHDICQLFHDINCSSLLLVKVMALCIILNAHSLAVTASIVYAFLAGCLAQLGCICLFLHSLPGSIQDLLLLYRKLFCCTVKKLNIIPHHALAQHTHSTGHKGVRIQIRVLIQLPHGIGCAHSNAIHLGDLLKYLCIGLAGKQHILCRGVNAVVHLYLGILASGSKYHFSNLGIRCRFQHVVFRSGSFHTDRLCLIGKITILHAAVVRLVALCDLLHGTLNSFIANDLFCQLRLLRLSNAAIAILDHNACDLACLLFRNAFIL